MAESTTITPESAAEKTGDSPQDPPSRIYLVPYPKVVFLYPTLILSLICAIWVQVAGWEAESSVLLSTVFLLVFGINMVVLAFDFPRTTSLTWFAAIAVIVMGMVLLFTNKPELWGPFTDIFSNIKPVANPTFFYMFFTILLVMFVAVGIAVQFDYWEVRPNELLHHHGVLSDLKRLATRNLRVDKEINDLFEYALLRSGRLILHPDQERKAIILENVLNINKKEAEITRMLGALQVQIRTGDD